MHSSAQQADTAPPPAIAFSEALRVWARIAALSFGGPAGQIAVMHRILVEEKGWVDEERFLHALNFCMLLPGPEAQQLATYIGWLLHRIRGGLAAGVLFILPGIAAIMGLSLIYVLYGDAGPVAGLFFGLKAAVIAIIFQAVLRIGKKALSNRARVAVAAAAFAGLFLLQLPFPLIVLGAGLIGGLAAKAGSSAFSGGKPSESDLLPDQSRPISRTIAIILIFLTLWIAPFLLIAATVGPDSVYADIAIFFSKLAVVTFGGAYAVLAYVGQAAVENFGWLTPAEMLDGLGLAETTPGPLIMVTQFVGFLAAYRAPGGLDPIMAAVLGGLLTTWVTFVPCFLWIFAAAPYVERLRANRALAAALSAITAAVVGVILNLGLWFALHYVADGNGRIDWTAAILSAAALIAALYFRIGVAALLLGSVAAGAGAWALGLT